MVRKKGGEKKRNKKCRKTFAPGLTAGRWRPCRRSGTNDIGEAVVDNLLLTLQEEPATGELGSPLAPAPRTHPEQQQDHHRARHHRHVPGRPALRGACEPVRSHSQDSSDGGHLQLGSWPVLGGRWQWRRCRRYGGHVIANLRVCEVVGGTSARMASLSAGNTSLPYPSSARQVSQ